MKDESGLKLLPPRVTRWFGASFVQGDASKVGTSGLAFGLNEIFWLACCFCGSNARPAATKQPGVVTQSTVLPSTTMSWNTWNGWENEPLAEVSKVVA